MAFCLSKLSRDRLQGVHPDLVRVVERVPAGLYYQHNLFRFHMVPVLPALFGGTLF